jgi:hypothetical protein
MLDRLGAKEQSSLVFTNNDTKQGGQSNKPRLQTETNSTAGTSIGAGEFMKALSGQWQLGRCATLATVVALSNLGMGVVHAKTLGHATVTQVNNDVRFKPSTGDERPAKPKDVVKGAHRVEVPSGA